MHSFYIESPAENIARLPADEAKHAAKVLRLRAGDEVCAMDGAGGRWRGELTDGLNRRGILEIKTTEIQHASQWKEWDGRIPAHYYAQILHQMIACEWADYVELFAHIRYQKDGETRAILRKYRIEREDVVPDLQWLLGKETAFFEMMLNGIEPPYVLPEI